MTVKSLLSPRCGAVYQNGLASIKKHLAGCTVAFKKLSLNMHCKRLHVASILPDARALHAPNLQGIKRLGANTKCDQRIHRDKG